jgi:hypothetical protein
MTVAVTILLHLWPHNLAEWFLYGGLLIVLVAGGAYAIFSGGGLPDDDPRTYIRRDPPGRNRRR